jgi:hypothetical protein
MALVLAGRIVSLSADTWVATSEKSAFKGKVWIGDDGRIAAVTKGTKKGPAGFESAKKVDLGTNLIVPGLIDLHSHLAYATLPLWAEKDRTQPYLHHDSWPSRPSYAPEGFRCIRGRARSQSESRLFCCRLFTPEPSPTSYSLTDEEAVRDQTKTGACECDAQVRSRRL